MDFNNFNVTRPLTVLPLTLIKILGAEVTNASAQTLVILTNILMLWFCIGFLLSRITHPVSSTHTTLGCNVFSFYSLDYTAYNSEHICCLI